MDSSEQQLYKKAKKRSEGPMSNAERAAQRESFAYGNTKIRNDRITREIIHSEAVKTQEERRD